MLNGESSVLVTGGTGLIGGEVIRGLLRREVKSVRAVVRPMPHGDAAARLRARLVRSDRPYSHRDYAPCGCLSGSYRAEPPIQTDSQTTLQAMAGNVTLPR